MSGDGGTGPRTLRAVLAEGVPAVEAVRLVAAVADDVATLHAVGWAHGRLRSDTVLIGDDGRVHELRIEPRRPDDGAAPAVLRADLHAVARLLAEALGTDAAEPLPPAVAALLTDAEHEDAPAWALAAALHRLGRDPLAAARLLPPPSPVRAAESAGHGHAPLAALVPPAERRRTGVAVTVLTAAMATGIVLLLVGAPAPVRSGGLAAVAAPVATAAAPADAAVVAVPPTAVDDPVAVSRALLRSEARPRTTRAPRVAAVESAVARPAATRVAAPAPVRSAAPKPAAPSPRPSASSAPVRTAQPAPSPSASTAPAAAPATVPATAPSAPAADPVAPAAPAASAKPVPAKPVPAATPAPASAASAPTPAPTAVVG